MGSSWIASVCLHPSTLQGPPSRLLTLSARKGSSLAPITTQGTSVTVSFSKTETTPQSTFRGQPARDSLVLTPQVRCQGLPVPILPATTSVTALSYPVRELSLVSIHLVRPPARPVRLHGWVQWSGLTSTMVE